MKEARMTGAALARVVAASLLMGALSACSSMKFHDMLGIRVTNVAPSSTRWVEVTSGDCRWTVREGGGAVVRHYCTPSSKVRVQWEGTQAVPREVEVAIDAPFQRKVFGWRLLFSGATSELTILQEEDSGITGDMNRPERQIYPAPRP